MSVFDWMFEAPNLMFHTKNYIRGGVGGRLDIELEDIPIAFSPFPNCTYMYEPIISYVSMY